MIKALLLASVFLAGTFSFVLKTSENRSLSEFDIVYSVDKDGLYVYDIETGDERKIYNTNQVFLNEKSTFLNETSLLIGHQNKHKEQQRKKHFTEYSYREGKDGNTIKNEVEYTSIVTYVYVTETFYAIDLGDGTKYKYKKIDYKRKGDPEINMTTTYYEEGGGIISKEDSTFFCSGMSYSYKGVKFCDFRRFFSKSEWVNGKQVFSSEGDLFMVNETDTTVLMKFDGNFDPKFGSGHYAPTISPDGKRVAYKYMAGFLNEGSGIFEINIESKEKREIIGEGFSNPKYSPDGTKLLVNSNLSKTKSGTWPKSIHIIDIESGAKTDIAEGGKYYWIPQRQ